MSVICLGGGGEYYYTPPSRQLIFDLGIDDNNQIKDLTGNSPISKIRNPQVRTLPDGTKYIDLHSGALRVDKPHLIRQSWISGDLYFECEYSVYNQSTQGIIFGSCLARDYNCPFVVHYQSSNIVLIYNNNWSTYVPFKSGMPNNDTFHKFSFDMKGFNIDMYYDDNKVQSNLNNFDNHGVVREYEVLIGDQTVGDIGNYAGHVCGYLKYIRIYSNL